jgi:hypothetical protein
VEATDPSSALALLARFHADRTDPCEIREVQIP